VSDKRRPEQFEHICVRGLIPICPKLEAEGPQRFLRQFHDHFTVEKVGCFAKAAAEFVSPQETDVAYRLDQAPDWIYPAVPDYIDELQIDG
jgi:hypothetical protein